MRLFLLLLHLPFRPAASTIIARFPTSAIIVRFGNGIRQSGRGEHSPLGVAEQFVLVNELVFVVVVQRESDLVARLGDEVNPRRGILDLDRLASGEYPSSVFVPPFRFGLETGQ
jgi:hypothetical protein